MNILKSAKNIFDTIHTKSVSTHSIEAKEAYEDCLSLLMPFNEMLADDRKESAINLIALTGAFAKYAKTKCLEAI